MSQSPVERGLYSDFAGTTPAQAAAFWGRPYMGGLDRHGVLANGTHEQIRAAVPNEVIDLNLSSPAAWLIGGAENDRVGFALACDFLKELSYLNPLQTNAYYGIIRAGAVHIFIACGQCYQCRPAAVLPRP